MSDNMIKIDKDTQALLGELDVIDLDKDPEFVLDSIKARFVEDICQAMKAKGISQSDLARLLGKTKQYVSRVLNETANFTLSSIVEISIALGCSVELRINAQPDETSQDESVERSQSGKNLKREFIENDKFRHLTAKNDQDHKNDNLILVA